MHNKIPVDVALLINYDHGLFVNLEMLESIDLKRKANAKIFLEGIKLSE